MKKDERDGRVKGGHKEGKENEEENWIKTAEPKRRRKRVCKERRGKGVGRKITQKLKEKEML